MAHPQVEVIMHTYIHDGPAARAVVSTMLLELARSPHARVVAVEIVVNASLRAQLLMDHALPLAASAHDQIVADDDAKCEQQTHCQDHEAALFIVADLRRQLLSLIGAAWQEEILDAHMSEAAVTALLLVCTCNGEFDRLVSQVLPLEALAALVSHTSSNATALHGDGMAHAALVRVLSQNLHCYTSHSRRAPITGEGGLEERGTGAQATWVACEKTGFEERLRRVGGIRFILLQLRNARSASCREQLYSIVMRYILLAVLEAHGEGSSSAEGEEGEEEEGGGDWEERDGERIVADARGLRMRAQEADEEGEWERACVEVVLQLDDYALPHALAQALWARSPNFSDLLAAHVAGPTKHHAAAAHALFAALEQVSVSFHLHDAAHWHHLGSSGEQACGRSWAPPELTSTGPGQGAGNAAAVEALAQVLLSDVCFERLSGVNDLFALHVRAPRPQGDCAAGCAWCKDCSWRLQAISAEADLPERARGDDFDSAVAGWQSGACLRGGEGDGELLGERSAADEVGAQGWVGVCILPVEQELLRKDARVGLGLLELTRKLLVHYKMSWGGCPAALRASLALRIQLLIAHRLEVIVSLVEDGTEGAMSCKCLTTLVDIILSMLTVGIPERAPHPCLGGDDRGEDLEGWQEGKREGWVKDAVDVGHGDELGAAGGEDEVGGDRLEDLVGDGTLALHLTALKVAPWSVIRYVSFPRHCTPYTMNAALAALCPASACPQSRPGAPFVTRIAIALNAIPTAASTAGYTALLNTNVKPTLRHSVFFFSVI